ncbi:aminomethyltransferase family protein [Desulforhopalus vacuolatus]|uniref:aminomethyltransferase family protein n=1 Tax=Desulforhopalus vacuolatus TaxID=40414 RepID=UPI0019659771|nr:aminomethyltransferase family protein [Desulforhopalus vacuolatus]MBM9518502.1 aminomethyltransferase family protein [Desulforhopalus vacuolatus]
MKTTPLHGWHVEQGANMAPFGEYEMPLWYPAGAKQEHLAVIKNAGLFDTSHMVGITVTGPGARTLLQHCFSKDLEHCLGPKKNPLVAGRAVYGVFLNNNGCVIDDGLVYEVLDHLYFVVVNSGMGGVITKQLEEHSEKVLTAAVCDLTDTLGKIDIQGPESAKILAKILENPAKVLTDMPYFSFKGWFTDEVEGVEPVRLKDGTALLLSRTGYTGEFGFEIFLEAEKTLNVWQMLLETGADRGILACGLAARDSLRAGAVLPLSHQDIGPWPFAENPWLFALPERDAGGHFSAKFIGSEALEAYIAEEYTLAFAGFDPRKMVISEKSFVCDSEGNRLGIILTCATDMAVGRLDDGTLVSLATSEKDGRPADFVPRGLSCGFVKLTKALNPGECVWLTDGKRKIKVEIRQDIRPDRTARRALKKMV